LAFGTWIGRRGAGIITAMIISETASGRSLQDPRSVVREARRLVGFERHYSCDSCGGERRSWTRLSSCPDCGERFASATIRRAALSGA
jgi:hypothetical protein